MEPLGLGFRAEGFGRGASSDLAGINHGLSQTLQVPTA